MKKPVVINAAPSGAFTPKTEVPGKPVAADRSADVELAPQEGVSAGIWECQPGHFRRTIMQREFSHFIAGHCYFTPDGGEPVEIRAGDAVYFPADCHGVWDVRETLRKSYLIID